MLDLAELRRVLVGDWVTEEDLREALARAILEIEDLRQVGPQAVPQELTAGVMFYPGVDVSDLVDD